MFGAAIGLLVAVLGYRMAFRSLLDDRTNWQPRVGKHLKTAMENEKGKSEPEKRQTDGGHDFDGVRDDGSIASRRANRGSSLGRSRSHTDSRRHGDSAV